MVPRKILISAGEASGDLYAAGLVEQLRRHLPEVEFFGCAGRRMRLAGVQPVVDASSLAVVGLLEVVGHIPRIYSDYRRMIEAARTKKPDLAILTDSPDFHLRLAARLRRLGIPVVYLVAPQVWAWRSGRISAIRRNIDRLLCIFPFEEAFFRRHGVTAHYIGHPLTRMVKPAVSKQEFISKHRLPENRPLITLLPGSRCGEIARHLPPLLEGVERLHQKLQASFVVAIPQGLSSASAESFLRKRVGRAPIHLIEGETWDAIAHADLALAASGTVTIEAALLGTPMVTFYRVAGLSWLLGRRLVRVPFYSMVNLVAGRAVVPELMQNEMRGEQLAAEALRLLEDTAAREEMRRSLQEVVGRLSGDADPMERAALIVQQFMNHGVSNDA
jgi:lipid-A-disaccharide synthase